MNAPNFKAWDIDVIDNQTATTEELFLNLVGWGVLAPSSHNSQPWRFIIYPESNSIDICLFEAGVLKHSDKKSRQAHISIGCASQNILAAAEYYDLDVRVEYFQDSFYPSPLVKLIFGQRVGKPKEKDRKILDAIKSRRMNRSKFNPLQNIPKELVDRIKTVVEHEGLVLNVITDTPTKFALAEIQYSADRSVIAINNFRKELGDFFLPNDTNQGIGMPGNTFGLSDEMAKYAHQEFGGSGPFDPDLAFGMAISGRDGLKSSPLIGIISVPEDSPLWWIKTGMVFGELALEAEISGLSVAVHAAMVEVEMFNRLLKIRLKQNHRPTVIFRMGYTSEQRPHSPRLCASEVSEIIGGN